MSKSGDQMAKPAAKLRVLLADASDENRAAMAAAVRRVQPAAHIVEARSGPEALGLMRADAAEAVVLDADLPSLSGIDALRQARKDGCEAFAILTATQVVPNWASLCVELKAYEFLKKPFPPQDFEALIHNQVRMRQPTSILIADASAQTRAMVRKVLSASNFAFEIAETDNGGHALKMARLQTFEVALIDASLHGLSGLETACQMQTQHQEMMVVCILPNVDGGLGQSLRHLGLAHTLRKPFFARDIDLLMHGVHNLRRPYLMNAIQKAKVAAMAS
jgi:CheY-like chemotaxis protein